MEKILVFLSRPNPFLDGHQYFLDLLQAKLDEAGLKTVTLQADNYANFYRDWPKEEKWHT